jgi:hypothetical protein
MNKKSFADSLELAKKSVTPPPPLNFKYLRYIPQISGYHRISFCKRTKFFKVKILVKKYKHLLWMVAEWGIQYMAYMPKKS